MLVKYAQSNFCAQSTSCYWHSAHSLNYTTSRTVAESNPPATMATTGTANLCSLTQRVSTSVQFSFARLGAGKIAPIFPQASAARSSRALVAASENGWDSRKHKSQNERNCQTVVVLSVKIRSRIGRTFSWSFVEKYQSIVRRRPSMKLTLGSHPSSFLARELSATRFSGPVGISG